jgi:hypothetical protein
LLVQFWSLWCSQNMKKTSPTFELFIFKKIHFVYFPPRFTILNQKIDFKKKGGKRVGNRQTRRQKSVI